MKNKLKFNETVRLIFQAVSFAFHNGYLKGWSQGKIYTGENKQLCMPGLNCYSCPGAIGACPIGSLQAVLDSGVQHFSLYVLGIIGMFGVFCGRLICGWMCPFGLVQDLLYRIPLFKKIKNLPGHRILRYLRFVILALFVIILPSVVVNKVGVGSPWFCEYICPSGMLFGGIPLVISNPSMRGAIGYRFYWKLFLLIATIVLSIKAYRPFCKYICPLGALYGCGNKISLYRLKVDADKCVQCSSCQRACGMDIKVWENPNSIDCIRCGKCKASCPTGAITSTLDNVIAMTGFSKGHKKAVNETESLEMSKFQKSALISALLLIISGAGIFVYYLVSILSPMLIDGMGEDRTLFILYILAICGPMIPAFANIIFGIKILLKRKSIERAEELLECTVIASKFVLVYIICTIIYAVFMTGGQEFIGYLFAFPVYTAISYATSGGIIAPLGAVASYFVLKYGIRKSVTPDIQEQSKAE